MFARTMERWVILQAPKAVRIRGYWLKTSFAIRLRNANPESHRSKPRRRDSAGNPWIEKTGATVNVEVATTEAVVVATEVTNASYVRFCPERTATPEAKSANS